MSVNVYAFKWEFRLGVTLMVLTSFHVGVMKPPRKGYKGVFFICFSLSLRISISLYICISHSPNLQIVRNQN